MEQWIYDIFSYYYDVLWERDASIIPLMWRIRLSLSIRVTIRATLVENLQKVCFISAVKLGGLLTENSLYVPKEVDVSDLILGKCYV